MLDSIGVRNKMKIGVVLFLLIPALGMAQGVSESESSASSTKASKKIYIQFDNELVDGKRDNPQMDYMFTRKEANYKKMMKLRDSFLPEVKKGKREFSGSK